MHYAATIADARELYLALRSLDGRVVVHELGKDKKAVQEPYKIKGRARIAIGTALATIRPLIRPADEHRDELQKQLDQIPDEADRTAALADAQDAIAIRERAEVSVDLPTLTYDDLDLDHNPIPGTTLALLAPLLTADD